MRSYFVVFVSIFFLFVTNHAFADIFYESGFDEPSYSNYSSGTRYSSGYGYEEDYDRGYRNYDDSYYDDPPPTHKKHRHGRSYSGDYSGRLPEQLSGHGEKVILIDPNVHAWGAYNAEGKLVRSGIAAAGSGYCRDLHRPCRTRSGSFRIYSLGDSDCYSKKFPLGRGGAPMPYCMYFNGGQALHGSYELADANISHGCVRIRPSDAEWLRYNFANIGTKVIVRPY